MKALFKTLFGDSENITVVAVIMLAELLLVKSGHISAACFVAPAVTLIGVVWLVGR